MIETYAFLAMFTMQVLAMSVLYPAWFMTYARRRVKSIPAERLAQMYPDVDINLSQQRFLTRYRDLNIGIAVLGLLLPGWLFSYMRRPDWNVRLLEILDSIYFMVQMLLPLSLVLWRGVSFNKLHKRHVLERKRKALLQPRGLFDFVSPFSVGLAILAYFLFAAFVIYIQQPPFAKLLVETGAVTLVYALQTFVIYVRLYGKKSNPFETHAGRVRTTGLVVKSCVYSCLACVAFVSLDLTLELLNWQRWEPFALSVFFVISALLGCMSMIAPTETDGFGSGGRLIPRTRDLSA